MPFREHEAGLQKGLHTHTHTLTHTRILYKGSGWRSHDRLNNHSFDSSSCWHSYLSLFHLFDNFTVRSHGRARKNVDKKKLHNFAHRGNLRGIQQILESNPEYLNANLEVQTVVKCTSMLSIISNIRCYRTLLCNYHRRLVMGTLLFTDALPVDICIASNGFLNKKASILTSLTRFVGPLCRASPLLFSN